MFCETLTFAVVRFISSRHGGERDAGYFRAYATFFFLSFFFFFSLFFFLSYYYRLADRGGESRRSREGRVSRVY